MRKGQSILSRHGLLYVQISACIVYTIVLYRVLDASHIRGGKEIVLHEMSIQYSKGWMVLGGSQTSGEARRSSRRIGIANPSKPYFYVTLSGWVGWAGLQSTVLDSCSGHVLTYLLTYKDKFLTHQTGP